MARGTVEWSYTRRANTYVLHLQAKFINISLNDLTSTTMPSDIIVPFLQYFKINPFCHPWPRDQSMSTPIIYWFTLCDKTLFYTPYLSIIGHVIVNTMSIVIHNILIYSGIWNINIENRNLSFLKIVISKFNSIIYFSFT